MVPQVIIIITIPTQKINVQRFVYLKGGTKTGNHSKNDIAINLNG
jgi:hypothetical protein